MDQYLSPEEVASKVPALNESKLAQLRFTGKGPRFYKPTAKTVLYKEADVIDWIESSAHVRTALAAV